MEMEMEIRFKKCGISNQSNVCIFDESVSFQVWSTPRTVSASQQTILGLLCVSLAAPDNRWHKCHLLSNKT